MGAPSLSFYGSGCWHDEVSRSPEVPESPIIGHLLLAIHYWHPLLAIHASEAQRIRKQVWVLRVSVPVMVADYGRSQGGTLNGVSVC